MFLETDVSNSGYECLRYSKQTVRWGKALFISVITVSSHSGKERQEASRPVQHHVGYYP